ARMVFNDCCGSLAIEAGNAARSCTSALLRKQRFGPISAAASKENKNPRRGGTGEGGIGGSAALVGRRNSEDNESPAFVIDVAQKEGRKTWEAAMACRPLGDVPFAPESGHQTPRSLCPVCAVCGRLRVGKAFLHVCRLVGAAMCSAC